MICIQRCTKCGSERIAANFVPDPCDKCGGKMENGRAISDQELKRVFVKGA